MHNGLYKTDLAEMQMLTGKHNNKIKEALKHAFITQSI